MAQQVYKSALSGDSISEAIAKINAMENTYAEAVYLEQKDAYVEIISKEDKTTYSFGIPAGEPGFDFYLEMMRAGYKGDDEQFYEDLLELLQPAIPYQHVYLKRYTHEQLSQFTFEQLNQN